MADDSELDYIRTFLGKVHTAATVKHFSEEKIIYKIADTSRMLVFPGEIIGSYLDVIIKRYKVKLYESTEALMMTALNNIVDGLIKLNKREAIAGYTKPGVLLNGEFISGNKAFENESKHWEQEIVLEFEWCTS